MKARTDGMIEAPRELLELAQIQCGIIPKKEEYDLNDAQARRLIKAQREMIEKQSKVIHSQARIIERLSRIGLTSRQPAKMVALKFPNNEIKQSN
jgi:hypothetical protein